MRILEHMRQYGHEQLAVYWDPEAKLQALIAIHDTTLGPAVGGVRVWPHLTEDEAVVDVLRLARAMTLKSAAAGLPLGGGKALIMADPRSDKTEAMFRAFGRFVQTLGGRYITTEDVGCTTQDMEWISQETEHVMGLPISKGSSGDPSIVTGFGVYQGMKACARHRWGTESLNGRVIAIQGFGNVASVLAHHLLEDGARLIATDISDKAMQHAMTLKGVTVVDPDAIYDVPCDIFSPNALGGVLNTDTIPRLKCEVICGGANNQLLSEKDAKRLQVRGILYAPDYIVNAGGIINVSTEIDGQYSQEAAMEKATHIADTMEGVIRTASAEDITTAEAADRLAEQRIARVGKSRPIYL